MFNLVPPTSSAGKFIAYASAYVKNHHTLVVIALGALLVWGITGKIQDAIIAHDQKVYDSRVAVLQAQVEKNAALAAANAQMASDYKAFAQQAQAANVQLEQANAKLAASLQQQQAVDAQLPPSELAGRIETLAQLPTNSVVPAPDNSFSVTASGAVVIAQTLEQVPVLSEQLDNAKAEKTNVDAQLAAQDKLVTGLNLQVTGLQTQIGDQDKACKAQVSLEKAKAGKGKWRWFTVGYVAGLATRGVVKIFTGV